MTEQETSKTAWTEGYKMGQRKMARHILELSVESVRDLAGLMAVLKEIADNEKEFIF